MLRGDINRIVVGHGAIVHACKVGDEVLVGMGAVILDGAVIGNWVAGHQIGAGDLEVDVRLPERLVPGMANLARGFRIPRFQTVLFLQQPGFQKEDSIVSSKHKVPRFHLVSLPLAEDTERGISRVSGYWASAHTIRAESEPPVNLLEILLEFASVSFVSPQCTCIKKWSQWPGLNRRPTVYETVALPLSYIGLTIENKPLK